MLCSEFVNEFPLCSPKEGTGKKKGGVVLDEGKTIILCKSEFLMILVRKQAEIASQKKKKLLFSGGTVINFRVENELASF